MSKRKQKIEVKQYAVGDVVQFLLDDYKVVEVLQDGEALHIKKIAAPFNTMVIPRVKLENAEATVQILEELTEPNDTTKRAIEESRGITETISKRFSEQEDITEVLDFSVKPDLLYRPDDRITLSVEISPEVQDALEALDVVKKEDE